jgi:hypothetical protein
MVIVVIMVIIYDGNNRNDRNDRNDHLSLSYLPWLRASGLGRAGAGSRAVLSWQSLPSSGAASPFSEGISSHGCNKPSPLHTANDGELLFTYQSAQNHYTLMAAKT